MAATNPLLPPDFEFEPHNEVRWRLSSLRDDYQSSWPEYSGAWEAMLYRFRFCAESDQTFTESIKRHGDSPPPLERYLQERELFCFFVSGLSAIESFCYGLYAIASMVDEGNFSLEKPHSISPESTSKRFTKIFAEEDITLALCKVVNDSQFLEWKRIRNILVHRVLPGRHIFLTAGPSVESQRPAEWKLTRWGLSEVTLDENTTATRRRWLAESLQPLLRAANSFTSKRF